MATVVHNDYVRALAGRVSLGLSTKRQALEKLPPPGQRRPLPDIPVGLSSDEILKEAKQWPHTV